jgi:hypothetical protein
MTSTTSRFVEGFDGRDRRSRDRGETTTQIVLLVPIVVSILMIAVQSAVYFHTSAVAGAAASHGASAAAARGESFDVAQLGREAARHILIDAGVSRSRTPVVTVTPETVSVGVEVDVARIVPYFPRTVRRVATEPRERFLTESMR